MRPTIDRRIQWERRLAFGGVHCWYTVKGTFSDYLPLFEISQSPGAERDLTSTTYIGTAPVPEPETFATLVTGICSMAGLALRNMRSI